jgi:hypothetical protein
MTHAIRALSPPPPRRSHARESVTATPALGYVDGPSLYEYVRSNPTGLLDAFGLRATAPPLPLAWKHAGSVTWGKGINAVRVSWSMQDVSSREELQRAMGTSGRSVFTVIKAKTLDRRCPYESFTWIQYSEARADGRVYTPPGGTSPWRGIDRYPNTNRPDGLPYTFLPAAQAAINRGDAYEGRVRALYDAKDADSIFIDWASSGGIANWGHYSVVTLVGRRDGKDIYLGSLVYQWSVDAAGTLKYGARPADIVDMANWFENVRWGYPDYTRDTLRVE